MCFTNDGIDDTGHFLLLCLSFNIQQRDLLVGVLVLLQPFVQIHTLLNNILVQLLLCGNKDLASGDNKQVFELTLNFIHQTGRFD